MNKKLVRMVERLNEESGKDYKLDLYTDGYGLSINHIIVANTVKGITDFIKEQLKYNQSRPSAVIPTERR